MAYTSFFSARARTFNWFNMLIIPLALSRKKQDCNAHDRKHCPKDSLPTNLFLECEVTDGYKDHWWQCHQHASVPKYTLWLVQLCIQYDCVVNARLGLACAVL